MGKKWLLPLAVAGGLGVLYFISRKEEEKPVLDVTFDLSSTEKGFGKMWYIKPPITGFKAYITLSNVVPSNDDSMLDTRFAYSRPESSKAYPCILDIGFFKDHVEMCAIAAKKLMCKKIVDGLHNGTYIITFGNGILSGSFGSNTATIRSDLFPFPIDNVGIGTSFGTTRERWKGTVRVVVYKLG